METLKDYIKNQKEMSEDKIINVNELIIVKKNKNGTVNCSTKINGTKVVINYINPKIVKDNTITVRYGKKNPEWKQEYWYQVDLDEEV